jgi:hypothetical protein
MLSRNRTGIDMMSDRSSKGRDNVRRSTGPRTRAGKQRSKMNASRHGLSSALSGSTPRARETEALSRAISAGSESAHVRHQASIIADCEMSLKLIRNLRAKTMEEPFFDTPSWAKPFDDNVKREVALERAGKMTPPLKEIFVMSRKLGKVVLRVLDDRLSTLRQLGRYERKIVLRKVAAVRELAFYQIRKNIDRNIPVVN